MARQHSDRQREFVARSAIDAFVMGEIDWQEAHRIVVKQLAGKAALRDTLRMLKEARQAQPRIGRRI